MITESVKILSASWIVPISSEPIPNGAIALSNDKILKVGSRDDVVKQFPNASIEDFGEAAITPSFVNCHSHLELSVMRGFLDDVEADFFKWLIKTAVTRDEKLTSSDIETSAMLGAIEGIRAGVTCFGDIGRFGKAGFEALKRTGLRGVVFQETEFSPHLETAIEDFGKLKEKFERLRENETDLVTAGISPHAPYTVSRRLFELIADFSLSENVKISIHAAESQMEDDLMKFGTGPMADFYHERGIHWQTPKLSSIEYLSEIGVLRAKPLLAHCVLANGKDIELIGESDSAIAHCPKSNAKFGHDIAPFEAFLDRGLRVGIGSDSVASNNSCDLLEEGRFAALIARTRAHKRRFVSAKETLEAMTLGGAKALRMDKTIGSLEAGKQADIVVISLQNVARQPIHDIHASLLFASNAGDVSLAFVAGKEIFRDGKVANVDEEATKTKVREIAIKMRET